MTPLLELGYDLVMKRINIAEARANLSRLLESVEEGETVVLCRRNVPIAEIRPIAAPRKDARPIGLGKGTFVIPPAFFEPLPDDVLDLFEGERGERTCSSTPARSSESSKFSTAPARAPALVEHLCGTWLGRAVKGVPSTFSPGEEPCGIFRAGPRSEA